MQTDSLHCTVHVSDGPDEKIWYKESQEVERLCLQHVFWTREAAADSVSLSKAQYELCEGPCPHVSLARPKGWE